MERILKQTILFDLKKEKKIKKSFKNICVSIYFFIALFQPPICPIKVRYFFILANIFIYLYISYITGNIKFEKRVIYIILSFLPFFLYFSLIQLCHCIEDTYNRTQYIFLFKTLVNLFLYAFTFVISISRICVFFKLNYHDIIKYLYYASILQLICVCSAFLIPSIREIFINFIFKYSGDEIIIGAVKGWDGARCFGFAENLFDSFGYITSILISIIFLEGLANHKVIFLISGIVMIFMPLVNARTGVVLAFIGIVIIMAYYFNLKNMFIIFFSLPFIILLAVKMISVLPDSTRDWIIKGFEETIDFINGDTSSGTYSQILGVDIVYPDNTIIGAGATAESISHYVGIDSGYIQCIWRFGLVGSILLFLGYLNMFRIAYLAHDLKQYKCICVTIIAIFFIYLFKLYSITNYGSVVLVFGIPTVISCSEE